jgi:hypothetical protein
MVITYYGYEFFKIQFGDTVMAVNPIAKISKLKTSRFGADIVLVSVEDPRYNGVEQVRHGSKEPFVVSGPGEYEIKKIFIKGFLANTGDKDGQNKSEAGMDRIVTIYRMSLEGMNLGFLAGLKDKELDVETRNGLSGLDVLFIPIGGGDVLGASDAYKLAVALEPSIIIPTHYGGSLAQKEKPKAGPRNALNQFLKEGGMEKIKPVDKLTLKKKDLIDKDGEIIIISPLVA